MDDYNLNTYRAGYQGFEGETIQYVGVGNTGLDYPLFPYLDLGGDNPSSFGGYGRFGAGALQFHTLVRYDAAAREERIFVGDRERTYTRVSVESPLRGISFVLPDENIGGVVPVVYLEDERGSLRDDGGRHWRRALPSEYAASARYGLVELSAAPKGMAAVYYPGGYTPVSLGAYGTPGAAPTPGTGFLGAVSDFFNQSQAVDLAQYPQPGGGPGKPAIIKIDGLDALVIYEKGTFSPFERQSRYGAPTSNSQEAALVRVSTGERIPGYEVVPVDAISVSRDLPLLAGTETQRGIYEIIKTAASGDRRSPEGLWPLGDQYPEIYLPGKQTFTQDLGVRFTNYGAAGAYFIGTDAVPGSIQVFRGGLMDANMAYDQGSGTVRLESPGGSGELIRITYLRQSAERRLGSLAAGIGATYEPGGPFSSALGLGVRWNVSSDSYSEEGASSPGTVGLGGRLAWDYERIKAQTTLGLGFEQPDTTGLYRAAGMEGNEITLGISSSGAFISPPPADSAGGSPLFSGLTLAARAPLVYRDYRDTNFLGSTTLMPIEWSGAKVINQDGPYPAMDSRLSSEVLAAEFSFTPEQNWTGFQVPLGIDAEILERAREIEIPFRFYDFPSGSTGDVRLIVQFGTLPDKDSGGIENPDLIVEGELTLSSADFTQGWLGNLVLSDEDRAKLQDARYMRVLIIAAGGSTVSGRILIAPPHVRGAGWRAITVQGGAGISGAPDSPGGKSVSAVETIEPIGNRLASKYGDIIGKLHPGNARQRVLELSWKGLETSPDESPGFDGRTNIIPLFNYRVLSFFIRGPQAAPQADGTPDTGAQEKIKAGKLHFMIARGPESLGQSREIALESRIPLSAFTPGEWSKVEILYGGGKRQVLVEGNLIPDAELVYNPAVLGSAEADTLGTGLSADSAGKTGYVALFLSPKSGEALPAGSFAADELILEEAAPAYRINAGAAFEWTRPGGLISYKGKDLLSDLSVKTALESGGRGDPFSPESAYFLGLLSHSGMELTFLGAKLSGNFSFSVSNEYSSWSGGHGVSRAWGPFSLRESFSTAPRDKTMAHGFGMNLSTLVHSMLEGDVRYDAEKLDRNWKAALGMNSTRGRPFSIALNADAHWTEKTGEPARWMPNYAETWARSWEPMLPDWGAAAEKREAHGLFKTGLSTRPVGVELSIDGLTGFSKPYTRTQAETLGRLDFPFTIGSYQGLFRGERSFRRSLWYAGEDIRDDGQKYFESIKDSLPLWYSIPIYSLFNPHLENTMAGVLGDSASASLTETGRFVDKMAFSLRFPERYGLPSFFLPNVFNAEINRVLEHKLDIPTDTLNLSTSLGFSAINLFGAFGTVPLFNFYQSDEFTHTLGTVISIPKQEDLSWRLQDEQAMTFHGFIGAELALTNTLTVGSAGWMEGLGLAWTVPAKKTLLGTLYIWLTGKVRDQSTWPALSLLAAAEYERLRKESLELVIDKSGDQAKVSIILRHESIIRIIGRLYLSAFSQLDCTQNYETKVFSFIGTIGTTLNISF
jgi:hypothetical protein